MLSPLRMPFRHARVARHLQLRIIEQAGGICMTVCGETGKELCKSVRGTLDIFYRKMSGFVRQAGSSQEASAEDSGRDWKEAQRISTATLVSKKEGICS